jgi:hypothetical protein
MPHLPLALGPTTSRGGPDRTYIEGSSATARARSSPWSVTWWPWRQTRPWCLSPSTTPNLAPALAGPPGCFALHRTAGAVRGVWRVRTDQRDRHWSRSARTNHNPTRGVWPMGGAACRCPDRIRTWATRSKVRRAASYTTGDRTGAPRQAVGALPRRTQGIGQRGKEGTRQETCPNLPQFLGSQNSGVHREPSHLGLFAERERPHMSTRGMPG